MDTSLLLPREQYEEVSKRYGRPPFTFEIKNNHQALFYFGANHSHDPANHQYPVLREYWDKFLYETGGRDRIVLIEGGLKPLRSTEENAIKDGSESALVTIWAHSLSISIASPDIKDSELLKLLPNNSKEETLLYLFLNFVDHWRRHADPKPDFDKYISNWVEHRKKNLTWTGIDFSLDSLTRLYKEIIGKDFNKEDDFNNLINPNKTGTKINEIARSQSNLREANIVSELERYWKEGKSIFIVFGNGHLIIQEPALKELLK